MGCPLRSRQPNAASENVAVALGLSSTSQPDEQPGSLHHPQYPSPYPSGGAAPMDRLCSGVTSSAEPPEPQPSHPRLVSVTESFSQPEPRRRLVHRIYARCCGHSVRTLPRTGRQWRGPSADALEAGARWATVGCGVWQPDGGGGARCMRPQWFRPSDASADAHGRRPSARYIPPLKAPVRCGDLNADASRVHGRGM